jgi:hypothetical protein
VKLFDAAIAIGIRYPSGSIGAQSLAVELAARLDELAPAPIQSFSSQVAVGVPSGDVPAIYVGLADDWQAEPGSAGPAWWLDPNDLALRVVNGADRINPACTVHELHVLARDESLLLRAVWLLLHELGWRHYQPNGVADLTELWVSRAQQTTLRTRIDAVWSGAVDHAMPSIAGGTSVLTWSDGSRHPGGVDEGDLAGALGVRPVVDDPTPTWLRHMGWTSSSRLTLGSAWQAVIDFDPTLQPWDAAAGTGQYTAEGKKLYTDDAALQAAARAYAQHQSDTVGHDWVSLARPDREKGWEVDFGDPTFGAKAPVTRQIELANTVATDPGYGGQGVVIQAYGECAQIPQGAQPDPDRVCVIVVEAYRPPGRTIEAVVADYVDDTGAARCPLGLYQFLYTAAWGLGGITASAANPAALVAAANRLRRLPSARPKVLGGEAMTEFGLYGLGYYCYLRLALDVGRVAADFTEADVERHANQFLHDMFPTSDVRGGIRSWYGHLLDRGHKPLLSSDLLHHLWIALRRAMIASAAGSDEQLRVVELCKYTRYLDLRNAFEAARAVGGDTEAHYDDMMAWIFRIRDSGLVDPDALFDKPLDEAAHTALGLGTVHAALNSPPAAWNTTVPSPSEFDDPSTGWVGVGLAANPAHGLTEVTYSDTLVGGWNNGDPRGRQTAPYLLPYKARGTMRLWLIPTDPSFTCEYRIAPGDGGARVELVNQATGLVEASLDIAATTVETLPVTVGQLYEVRLTTYATPDGMWLTWWGSYSPATPHYLSFDPGRDGDPGGFGAPLNRSMYFLVPDGVSQLNFYAETVNGPMELLYLLDAGGAEVKDATFQPQPRAYQSHPVAGSGRRVLRISGVKINEIGFWLLNCPNLFALHPHELLRPLDA